MKSPLFKLLAIAFVIAVLFLNVNVVLNNKAASNFQLSAVSNVHAQASSTSGSGSGSSSSGSGSGSGSGSSSSSSSGGGTQQEASKTETKTVTYYWDASLNLWIVGTKGSVTKTETTTVTFKCCMAGSTTCGAGNPPC